MIPLVKCRRCVYRINMSGLGQHTACGYLYYTGNMRPGDDNNCTVYLPSAKNKALREKLQLEVKKDGLKPLGKNESEYFKYLAEKIVIQRKDFKNEH